MAALRANCLTLSSLQRVFFFHREPLRFYSMLLSSEAVPFARTSFSDEAALRPRDAARFGTVRRGAAWRGVVQCGAA